MIPDDNRLFVNNIAQKIIFCCEMRGQISDGKWENLKPTNHWIDWMLPWENVVVTAGAFFGRNFHAPYDKYNFSDGKLLKLVGHRIMFKIKFYFMYPEAAEHIYSTDHWLLPTTIEGITALEDSILFFDHMYKRRQKLEKFNIRVEDLLTVYHSNSYTKDQLKQDCEQLKETCRYWFGVGKHV